MNFIKSAALRLIGAGSFLQVMTYIFGMYEEAYDLLRAHRLIVALMISAYVFLYWVTYDAQLVIQKRRYNDRLKGASLRIPRRKKKK